MLLDGPDVEGIVRELPSPRDDAKRRVGRAIAQCGARQLEAVQVPDDGSVLVLPLNPREVRALALSTEELPELGDGMVLHQWERE